MPDDKEQEEGFGNVREFMGHFIGASLVDITQTDFEELTDENNRIHLHFSNGKTISFDAGCYFDYDSENEEQEEEDGDNYGNNRS